MTEQPSPLAVHIGSRREVMATKDDVLELIRLAETLIASADNAGCSEDLTVVSQEALNQLHDWIVNRFGEDDA